LTSIDVIVSKECKSQNYDETHMSCLGSHKPVYGMKNGRNLRAFIYLKLYTGWSGASP
jgi:hypothetical protein